MSRSEKVEYVITFPPYVLNKVSISKCLVQFSIVWQVLLLEAMISNATTLKTNRVAMDKNIASCR